MFPVTAAEVVQLAIGSVLGTVVSLNMSRFGLSFADPQTRWTAAWIVAAFLLTFLILTDLIIN
jgi:hypothetical protein